MSFELAMTGVELTAASERQAGEQFDRQTDNDSKGVRLSQLTASQPLAVTGGSTASAPTAAEGGPLSQPPAD